MFHLLTIQNSYIHYLEKFKPVKVKQVVHTFHTVTHVPQKSNCDFQTPYYL